MDANNQNILVMTSVEHHNFAFAWHLAMDPPQEIVIEFLVCRLPERHHANALRIEAAATCRMTPSLPEVSMPCRTTSTLRSCRANSISWRAESRCLQVYELPDRVLLVLHEVGIIRVDSGERNSLVRPYEILLHPYMMPEPWLRGPLPGIPQLLQPPAHALVMALEDVERAVAGLSHEQLWRPRRRCRIGRISRHASGRQYRTAADVRARREPVRRSAGGTGRRA